MYRIFETVENRTERKKAARWLFLAAFAWGMVELAGSEPG
jgi:hypothetical protein